MRLTPLFVLSGALLWTSVAPGASSGVLRDDAGNLSRLPNSIYRRAISISRGGAPNAPTTSRNGMQSASRRVSFRRVARHALIPRPHCGNPEEE